MQDTLREALLVGQQVLVIFIFIFIGYLSVRKGIITKEAGRSFSNLTLTLVMPSVIINSYMEAELDRVHLQGLGLAFALAIVFHILAICGAKALIPEREDVRCRIERLAAVYSNCGFMGIPLIKIALGDVGVFYSVAYISVFNVLVWSNGTATLQPGKKPDWKKMLFNPGTLGFLIGAAVYLTQVPLPAIAVDAVSGMSRMNTPLSMITTGIFLANIRMGETFRTKRLYYVAAIRLLLLPLAMITLVKVLGVTGWMNEAPGVVMASMLACACPTATTATLLPARFGLDSEYGAKLMGMSTLISIVTLPLISMLTNWWLMP